MKIICDGNTEAKDTYAGEGFVGCSYKCPKCKTVWQVQNITAWAEDSELDQDCTKVQSRSR